MKKLLLIYTLVLCTVSAGAQNLYLKAEGSTKAETSVLDSLAYAKVHPNAKAVQDEAQSLSARLYRSGYLENRITGNLKANDSTFIFSYALGSKTTSLLIYTTSLSAAEKMLLTITTDTLTLPFNDVEAFMNRNLALLEQSGYAITTLQLIDYKKEGSRLTAQLKLSVEKKRTLDDIVLEGYPKFPEGIRRNIARQYKGKAFNKENLQRIHNDFTNLQFVTLPRYPEILFKQDTTKVYVYLEKTHPNTFDGFIGFSNDDQSKLRFNGYLDLLLNNVLNSGEKFNLYWKNNGEQQSTFNLALELPYLFKSPIGAKAGLKIFKQDSTFQNTVTDLNLGYYFSYNSRLFAGYQRTQSTDIQNTDNSTLSDYNSKFWTASYELDIFNPVDLLFRRKTVLNAKAGTGSRDSKVGNTGQYFAQLNISHNLYLSPKNSVNIKNQSFYLNSSNYITNELQRFGGINSIRGFNENTLQGNLYSLIMAEYRYMAAPNLYIHSITDYGYAQDEVTNTKNRMLGLGFGFGLLSGNGLFNLIYANGTANNQTIKLSNSIVHISFKTSF
ncbi:hypothetical protein ACLI09_03735 [Flavobacterium sp. RHBU_24]|uniref:hypothetical protein n=1 Tax=Flavobacterium sp. RHBU_24 TaxID=3391185 RepID=UPI003984DC36